MMRSLLLCLAALCFAACDTPGPGFRGVPATRVAVGQSVFDVRVDGNRAEAVRLNAEWAPRLEAVAPRAVKAIEQVSGCVVTKLGGDAALVQARLKCGKGGGRAEPLPERLDYDCDFEDGYVIHSTGEAITELRCERRPWRL